MSRPVPKPGILDIAPYTPGKSGAGLTGRVFKLSANETPLGPSPKAIAAYKAAADHLEDYPEGTSRALRETIGRTYGLDPDRISAARARMNSSTISRTPILAPATKRFTPPTAFWFTRSRPWATAPSM